MGVIKYFLFFVLPGSLKSWSPDWQHINSSSCRCLRLHNWIYKRDVTFDVRGSKPPTLLQNLNSDSCSQRNIVNISLFVWTNKRKIEQMIKYEYKSLIVSRNLLILYKSIFNLWKIVKNSNPKTCNLTLFRLLPAHENKKWICLSTVLYDVICYMTLALKTLRPYLFPGLECLIVYTYQHI